MKTKKVLSALLWITCFLCGLTLAQEDRAAITIGEQFSIHSIVLNEQRNIIVGLPAGYALSDANYPVLYVLDGSTHFHYTTGITQFLAANQFMPEMIVVAVNNTDRARDLTPPSQDPMDKQRMPSHGGADNFQRFFAEDLMPWVEQNYRTHPYNILIGHSLGGLFAIHTLTTRPDLFNAYIAISPSMQWNGQGLVEQADKFFKSTEQLPATLYMTAGNEGGPLLGGARKLAGVLDVAAPKEFLWHFEHMPLETHGTVPHRSTYQGLEFVFANWVIRDPYKTYLSYGLDGIEKFHAAGDKRYGVNRGIPLMTLNFLLGNLVMSGDLAGAVDLMSRPSVSANAYSGMHEFLANALKTKGDQVKAAGFFRQALLKNPGNMGARQALDEWGIDYSDLMPQVVVGTDILRRYEGVYSLQESADITVMLDGDTLHRELNGVRYALLPINETEFYLREDDIRYQFQLNGADDVSGISITLGGTRVYATKR